MKKAIFGSEIGMDHIFAVDVLNGFRDLAAPHLRTVTRSSASPVRGIWAAMVLGPDGAEPMPHPKHAGLRGRVQRRRGTRTCVWPGGEVAWPLFGRNAGSDLLVPVSLDQKESKRLKKDLQ